MIAKDFLSAKAFRVHSTNFLRQKKKLRDHGGCRVARGAGAADVTGDTPSPQRPRGLTRAGEPQFPDRRLCAPSAGMRNTPKGAPNGGYARPDLNER